MRLPQRFLLISLVCLFFSFNTRVSAALNNPLTIKEAETHLRLRGETPEVALSIENASPQTARARIVIELIDLQGKIRACTESELAIAHGAASYTIPFTALSTPVQKQSAETDFMWYRLRYRLSTLDDKSANPLEGIISLSEIASDLFALNVSTSGAAAPGSPYRVRVRAVHPRTMRPVEGVRTEVTLEFADAGSKKVEATALTGADGYADLVFNLPDGINDREGEIKVVGRLGALIREVKDELFIDHRAAISISTDKQIYQPGQTLHLRALLFDREKRALANQKAILKITDPDGTVLYRAALETSRFGIAATDWLLPENARLGEYKIKLEVNEGYYKEAEAEAAIRISRYELPNFALSVKPDRSYYLPGQNATVEIRADYLFGQSVRRGKVRVVRERERQWNYRQQKWEAEEGAENTGETDASGRFIARINLAQEHKALTDESWTQYRDVSYAAYFTDPTTNRTEQRRFDLRLSKEDIHIYFSETGYAVQGYPANFYLSAFYADGTPAKCKIVIDSAVDDETSAVEKEIRAFQPFFAEHDPPRVLTEGDEIALPVVLRNYLDRAQKVSVEIKPESWFELLSAAQKSALVAAGEASREIFEMRAVASIKDGKQRVTVLGAVGASDAIEKPVDVHPNGEELFETASRIFNSTTTLDLHIREDAIPDTARGELKIYPNLMAHVIESVEGIMQRPYGCGEQTISSTYPSLLLLRYYKDRKLNDESSFTVARARRYVRLGYERLLGYRAESGGFTYWGRGEPDLALSAYALRFLRDASAVMDVDQDVLTATRDWLIKQQKADGSWPALEYQNEHHQRTSLVTSFVARVLADEPGERKSEEKRQADAASSAALQRALVYLSRRTAEIDEPYLLASYALAARAADKTAEAAAAVARLQKLRRDEGDGSYWALETNTPFYGWGQAGRIETTALAVQALARQENSTHTREATDTSIKRALLFLLSNKDRYGVWLSTQATINVLDTLMLLAAQRDAATKSTIQKREVVITVNNQRVTSVELPSSDQLANPLTVNVSKFLRGGENKVEVHLTGEDQTPQGTQAQLVASYYVPWAQNKSSVESRGVKANSSSALRLAVNYDQMETSINQEITCSVEAERVGFNGYGMMLAEIGLPPGAQVDRESLDKTMKDSGWAINRYDVLPDRLIVYLWPQGGGTKFKFKFRPRFGLRALTAPSIIYDYYNPEAHVTLAPTRFVVRP